MTRNSHNQLILYLLGEPPIMQKKIDRSHEREIEVAVERLAIVASCEAKADHFHGGQEIHIRVTPSGRKRPTDVDGPVRHVLSGFTVDPRFFSGYSGRIE